MQIFFFFYLLSLGNNLRVVSLTSFKLRQADFPLFMLFPFGLTGQTIWQDKLSALS